MTDDLALETTAPTSATDGGPAPEVQAAVRAASMRRIVSESLRGAGAQEDHGPRNTQEQAALGAAVTILGACLADEAVGPMPELTAGLVQIILTPPSAS